MRYTIDGPEASVCLGARSVSDSEDEAEFVRCVDGLDDTGESGICSFFFGEVTYANVNGWFWCI